MKLEKLSGVIAGLLIGLGCMSPAFAQVTLEVDMDPITPGVQSTWSAFGPVTATVMMTVGPAGVSSYFVSALFDNTELTLVGAPASTELLPAGFTFNLTAGVASESQILGQVYTFEAGTFGLGPVSTGPFSIGTINFTVTSIVDDAVPDITLGFYNVGTDGVFDNAGNPVAPTFVAASVAPEPSAAALLAGGMLALWMVQRVRHGRAA